MNKVKYIFQQTMLISTAILFVIGVQGIVRHIQGKEFALGWYYPISIILTGFFCALPTVIWLSGEELTKRQFIVRLVCHCIFLLSIVSLAGYLFHWYDGIQEYLCIALMYFAIYIFVWLTSLWMGRIDECKINTALKDIQDEE